MIYIKNNLLLLDIIAYLLLLIIFGIGLYFSQTDVTYFDEVYVREDGLIEYATSILLLLSSILLVYRFFKLKRSKSVFWKLGIITMSLLFLFAAGEEISWGQRIFDFESSDFFLKNNGQGETNLHNLIINNVKINQLIFSKLLISVLIIYLVVLPILYGKFNRIKKWTNQFAVPVVQWHHTIAFAVLTALLLFIQGDKKWELYEFAFGLIFLLIFLNPFNKSIYLNDKN